MLEEVLGRSVEVEASAAPSANLPHYKTGTRVFVSTRHEVANLTAEMNVKETVLVMGDEELYPMNASGFKGVIHWQDEPELYSILRQAEKDGVVNLVFVKDSGIPWSDAVVHRLAQAAKL
jgi:hypothetical protein